MRSVLDYESLYSLDVEDTGVKITELCKGTTLG